MKRSKLIKELENYKYVPGHGPDYSKMTNEQLYERLRLFRWLFSPLKNNKNKTRKHRLTENV